LKWLLISPKVHISFRGAHS